MKVLYFSHSLKVRGGVASYSKIILKEISHNYQVDHHIIGNRLYMKKSISIRRFLYPFYDILRLLWKLHRNSYDIIHINPSMSKYSIIRDSVYLFILRKYGYLNKTIIFFRGWNRNTIGSFTKSNYLKKLFLDYYGGANRILVLATSFKQTLTKLGINEKKILLTTTLYKKSQEFRIRKTDKNEIINIVFLARFIKNKGIFIVCQILKKLVDDEHKNVHFIFAGDGPEMNRVRSFIHENKLSEYADIVGYVDGSKKAEILSKGDILLFPTKHAEGLPNAILEAMGSGMAIISTPVGGIPEVIEDGINGFLHSSEYPSVFYNSIKNLMKNRSLLRKIQMNNIEKAEKNFEASIVVKKLENLYLDVANDRLRICRPNNI